MVFLLSLKYKSFFLASLFLKRSVLGYFCYSIHVFGLVCTVHAPLIVTILQMAKSVFNLPSPKSYFVLVPGLDDCNLLVGDKSTIEVGTHPPHPHLDSEFDITV